MLTTSADLCRMLAFGKEDIDAAVEERARQLGEEVWRNFIHSFLLRLVSLVVTRISLLHLVSSPPLPLSSSPPLPLSLPLPPTPSSPPPPPPPPLPLSLKASICPHSLVLCLRPAPADETSAVVEARVLHWRMGEAPALAIPEDQRRQWERHGHHRSLRSVHQVLLQRTPPLPSALPSRLSCLCSVQSCDNLFVFTLCAVGVGEGNLLAPEGAGPPDARDLLLRVVPGERHQPLHRPPPSEEPRGPTPREPCSMVPLPRA